MRGGSVVLTDEQVRAASRGQECVACGGRKLPGAPFCPTDHSALTPWVRRWLADGPESPQFAENFRAALRHLQLNPTRRRRFGVTPGAWPYHSMGELERGGYVFVDHAYCRAPGCGASIMWYRVPDGSHKTALNAADCQPHRASCAAPDHFLQRPAQTSARKRRARR